MEATEGGEAEPEVEVVVRYVNELPPGVAPPPWPPGPDPAPPPLPLPDVVPSGAADPASGPGAGAAFGVCRSCSHFQREGAGRYRCGLTQEPLSASDSQRLCREHSAGEAALAR